MKEYAVKCRSKNSDEGCDVCRVISIASKRSKTILEAAAGAALEIINEGIPE